jgi:sensitive to high expression protein 9, mitochondrial
MNSVPWLLRQSLRPSLRVGVSVGSPPRRRAQIQKLVPTLFNRERSLLSTGQPGVCLICQLRTHSARFSSSTRRWQDRSQTKDKGQASAIAREPDSKAEENAISASQDNISEANIAHQDEERLPSESERRRSRLVKQFSQMMDNVQGNVFIVGQRLNDLTGYSAIEKLKKDIDSYGK